MHTHTHTQKRNENNLLLRMNSSNFSIKIKIFGILIAFTITEMIHNTNAIDTLYEYVTSSIDSHLNRRYAIDAVNVCKSDSRTSKTFVFNQ